MAEARDPNKLAISPPPSMIEVDNRAALTDDGLSCDSRSITSSIYDYEYENGRRYHAWKAGSYPLPNDEQELDRIDLKHHVMTLLCDGYLHLAPLNRPRRVLDLGTGTGIWAIEMGEQYPETSIHGVDLSPVQPEYVPSNVHFEIDDVEAKDWAWPDNHFDYIHSRFMLSSISSWQRYIRKAFQHTKPGGHFELQELDCRFASDDGSLKDDSNLAYWSREITKASANYNRPIAHYHEFFKWFEKAGFVDIKQVILKSPTNPWPKNKKLKEVGKFQSVAHLEGLEGISIGLLTRGAKWKADEVSVLMAKVRPEVRDRSIHSYQTNVIVVGRKPDTPRTPDSLKDGLSYGWASRTSGGSKTGTIASTSSNEHDHNPPGNPAPQASSGVELTEMVSAFTPIAPITKKTR